MITIKNTNTSPSVISWEGVSITIQPQATMPVQEAMIGRLPSGVVVVSEKMITEPNLYGVGVKNEDSGSDKQLLNETRG